jgi:hypothetical protein
VTSARWTRPTRGVGTRYVDRAGRDVLLHPGQTWIMLVPTGARVATSH